MPILEMAAKFGIYAVMATVLIFALGELVFTLLASLTNPPVGLLENHELLNVLGIFLLVLIGIELLDTMMAYFRENAIHVEIVILLAIIAVARKVILIDPTGISAYEYGFELMGIGVIVVGLTAGYYLIKKSGITVGPGVTGRDGK